MEKLFFFDETFKKSYVWVLADIYFTEEAIDAFVAELCNSTII